MNKHAGPVVIGVFLAAVVWGTLQALDVRAQKRVAVLPPEPSPAPMTVADFGPSNGAVANTKSGDLTALFLYSPGEHRDVLSNDFRWVYINLRDRGSIKIDREAGHAWFCPTPVSVLGPDPEKWCRDSKDGVALNPWQMIPKPHYDVP